jgi:hypothetical protein
LKRERECKKEEEHQETRGCIAKRTRTSGKTSKEKDNKLKKKKSVEGRK